MSFFFDDAAWFTQAALKRRAQESSVILVESSDPKRIQELRTYIRADNFYPTKEYFNTAARFDVLERFELSPWKGLLKLRTGRFDNGKIIGLEDREGNTIPDQPVEIQGGFLPAIRYVEEQIAGKPDKSVVLLVTNITQKSTADAISMALQELAHDGRLTTKLATIIVVTPDIQLFDSYTRRMACFIKPPISTDSERAYLVADITRRTSYTYDPEIIRVMEGLTLHDCESLLLELVFGYSQSQQPHHIKMKDVARAKMNILHKYGYKVEYPKDGYEVVGGCESIKQVLRENVINILNDPRADEMGVGPAKGIIFFGPPGTGKSLLARTTSKEIGLPLVLASPATFLGGIVGESERKTEEFFSMIETMRSLCLIDEADALGQKRENVASTDSGAGRHVVNMTLDYMGREGRKSIIILSTNLIEGMDEAFTRPGRIDLKIPILYPNLKARYDILKVHTSLKRKIPIAENGDLLADIAKMTGGWVGSELENLVTTAARKALHKSTSGKIAVGKQDFIEAMTDVGVNPDARKEQMTRFLKIAEKYSSSRAIVEEQLAGDNGGGEQMLSRVDIVEEQLKGGVRKKK